jgi:hypothetical protein
LDFKSRQGEASQLEFTELLYIFKSGSIAEFESRAESLRNLLLEDLTALSEKEMSILVQFFEKGIEEIDCLYLLSLASILEPLIENSSYWKEIESILKVLLRSSKSVLRYAALDVISYGLGVTSVADILLKEAQILLATEDGYVRDYLESL